MHSTEYSPHTGDGWTTRVEDAMLHGCIPVLFMDNVIPVYGTILDEEDVYGEWDCGGANEAWR